MTTTHTPAEIVRHIAQHRWLQQQLQTAVKDWNFIQTGLDDCFPNTFGRLPQVSKQNNLRVQAEADPDNPDVWRMASIFGLPDHGYNWFVIAQVLPASHIHNAQTGCVQLVADVRLQQVPYNPDQETISMWWQRIDQLFRPTSTNDQPVASPQPVYIVKQPQPVRVIPVD
ncbi:MAG: hypothetical protein EBR79_00390 [Proteobacteria bacterium]|nr:hypothetical protein [Pseudomonadota bacterium]NBX86319.1 hypothetical protein [Pseudomonadota bacterium]